MNIFETMLFFMQARNYAQISCVSKSCQEGKAGYLRKAQMGIQSKYSSGQKAEIFTVIMLLKMSKIL